MSNTRELTKEEGEALTKDLQEVLTKHNCELGVVSSIQLLRRTDDEGVVSPIQVHEEPSDTTEEEAD